MSYNREKIIENYGDYETFLNGEKIAFNTFYLDEENIDSFIVYTHERKMYITQLNKDAEYISLQDYLSSKEGEACSGGGRTVVINSDTVIVNGELARNVIIKKIERSAIKNIEFIREPPFIIGECMNGTLTITLK